MLSKTNKSQLLKDVQFGNVMGVHEKVPENLLFIEMFFCFFIFSAKNNLVLFSYCHGEEDK